MVPDILVHIAHLAVEHCKNACEGVESKVGPLHTVMVDKDLAMAADKFQQEAQSPDTDMGVPLTVEHRSLENYHSVKIGQEGRIS